jgi:microcystin-dependent protein
MLAWLRALFARWFGGGAAKPPAPNLDEAFRPGPTPPPPSGMQQLIVLNGTFPQRGTSAPQFTIGMIESFAGSYPAYGMAPCTGGTLPILQHQPLVAVIGLTFGGNGMETIGLPDLHGRVAIGGGQVGQLGAGTLILIWLIATSAASGAPLLGTVAAVGGNFPPSGWAICDGSDVTIPQNLALFETIGTAFGGNPQVYFMLPNLNGAAPVGVGPTMQRGQRVTGASDGVGLYYLINTAGPLAPPSGNGAAPAQGNYAGQVIAYAGAQVPEGWAVCDGSVLAVTAYPMLFQAIGNLWGGDGRTSFALPDLRGKMLPGA